jgi:predicted nucleic acid-binding protein
LKIFIDSNLLIYLNALKSLELRKNYEDFYSSLLLNYKAYLDVLVLDELIYISKKRYNVPYEISIKFLESIVLPYVQILPLSEVEYKKASEILKISNVKPSDALHIAVMMINNITKIASEDKELGKIKGIERIWLP